MHEILGSTVTAGIKRGLRYRRPSTMGCPRRNRVGGRFAASSSHTTGRTVPYPAVHAACCRRRVGCHGHSTHPASQMQSRSGRHRDKTEERIGWAVMVHPWWSALDLGGRVRLGWPGLQPPPPAADRLDRARHPAFVCHQMPDGKEWLPPGKRCQPFSPRHLEVGSDGRSQYSQGRQSCPRREQ
jgi:hypothetical protein